MNLDELCASGGHRDMDNGFCDCGTVQYGPDGAVVTSDDCDECGQPVTAPVTNIDGPDERVWCSQDCLAATGERQSVPS